MRGAPGLLAHAARAGLIPPADVLGGRAWLEATPRSNVVHRVVRGGYPVAYSKQRGAASRLDGDDPVAHERRVLPTLAALRCVPSVLTLSDEQCLWTGAIPGTPLLHTWGTRGAVLARCRAFGVAVGALHHHPGVSDAPEAPRPWVLTPDRLPPSMGGADAVAAFDPVREALADPDIRVILDALRAHWTPRTWIHGDLGPANVLVAESEESADPEVWLVDLEHAGAGEPGWDLAIALDTLAVAADGWSVPAGDAFAAFGSGYRAAGGRARPDAAWRCAQALTRAWRVAGTAAAGTASAGMASAGMASAGPIEGHPPGEGSAADPGDAAWQAAANPDGQVAALLAQARTAARRARRSGCIGVDAGEGRR